MTTLSQDVECLFYMLLRDTSCAGGLEKVIQSIEDTRCTPGIDGYEFSNEYIAGYAKELAGRLLRQ